MKKWLTGNGARPLDTPIRLTAGALAGITSVSVTYPLGKNILLHTQSLNFLPPPTL